MLSGKKSRKAIAATLLLVFTTNVFGPSVTYALTSGPTQPEATSFEPIDTTDMVNMQTGDFTYNIPLLEVPGPEGGYPLSLSYHAGIQPNEDASWVGLGWTLNPGAISRNVNGYPDDWSGPTTSSHVFWSGGQTTTHSYGLNVGIANVITAGADLSFSQDTYRGFGLGGDISIGFKIGKIKSVGIYGDIGVGSDPYGGEYVFGGVHASIGVGGLNASAGIGFSTNFQSLQAGFSGGISYSIPGSDGNTNQSFSGSLLRASISTGGNKPSLSVGGLSMSVSNSKAGNISTSSKGWHVDIPVYAGINVSLGYSKVRYWTNETVGVATYGSLQYNGNSGDNIANDWYSLQENPAYKNMLDYPDPTVVQGGAFPDYDRYSVNAQGLGGNIRPYILQGGFRAQNIKNGTTPLVSYYDPGIPNGVPFFRFENDFSNSYRQAYPTYSDPSIDLLGATPPFDGAPVHGNNDGNIGYAPNNNLAGSKHVDVGIKVHPTQALGYNSGDRLLPNMIEGFSITNESGVTYHFGLPAYAYGEEDYQEKIQYNTNGTVNGFNRGTKPNAYAYTWYLTTITGPDFVDRDGDGKAGDGDWGYWVNFEYGKWSNKYTWRNPSEGFHRDQDNQWRNCSIGNKEVYYLNAIRTRTHVALFEKDLRYDGKGESIAAFNKNTDANTGTSTNYNNNGIFDVNSSQSLKLSKIYLLNSADENLVTPGAGGSGYYAPSRTIACPDCEQPAYVLDANDIDLAPAGRALLESRSLRIIDFNYDYSLCPGTNNSFNSYSGFVSSLAGKLTLNNITMRGKGGASLIPPISFSYDLTGNDAVSQSGVSLSPGSFTTTNGNFNVGDLIWSTSLGQYCGAITFKSPTSPYTYTLVNNTYTGAATTANISTTKNAPYNKDAYDAWGMYKSDFSPTLAFGNGTTDLGNENLARMTSPVSSKGVDVWSLRKIHTSLGSDVAMKYEGDVVGKSVLNSAASFVASSVAISNIVLPPPDVNGNYSSVISSANFSFTLNTGGYNLTDFFSQNESIDVLLALSNDGTSCSLSNPSIGLMFAKTKLTINSISGNVITATGNNITVLAYSVPNTFQPTTIVGFRPNYSACTANLFVNRSTPKYGGDIRVRQVSVTTGNTVASTNYSYSFPSGNESGVTSYNPNVFEPDAFTTVYPSPIPYRKLLYGDVNYLLVVAREIPPPSVMYESVIMTNTIVNPDEATNLVRQVEGSTQYQFEVFRPNMINIEDYTARTGPIPDASWNNTNMSTRNLVLQKFTGSIGNVKRTIKYDANGKKLTETVFNYLHDRLENADVTNFMSQYGARLSQYNYQGFVQERVAELKWVQNQTNTNDNGVMATLSARENYPCIATGQTVFNYVNGTKSTSRNLAYDFYSGALTESVETDGYGNNFLTQTIPAYTKYFGDFNNVGMGLKVNYDHNLNMLTQPAGTYIWKVDASNTKLGLVAADVNTWTNGSTALSADGGSHIQDGRLENIGGLNYSNGNVWRMQLTYDWLPVSQTADGLTAAANFNDFNWASPASSDPGWKNSSTITLYDVHSKPLEEKDINGNYSATHMNYGEKNVILSGAPANFYEMAYSGAEDGGVNQANTIFIKAADGTTTTAAAHTGVQSLLLGTSGKRGFLYSVPTGNLVTGRTYQASVWVKPSTGSSSTVGLYYDIDGVIKSSSSSPTSTKNANGWTLVNLIINGNDISPGHTLNVWCRNDDASISAYIDDMRFQPLNANTTAYVYDPFSGELTYILDNNNIYTNYVYDGAGRLLAVNKEKLGSGVYKKSDYSYNYSSAPFQSAAIPNSTYYKNDCGAGYSGSAVSINLPQGAYVSYLSQQEADTRAYQGAQLKANQLGSCIPTSSVPVSISSGMIVSVSFMQGATVVASKTFANTGGSLPVPNGTYTVIVSQTNNISHSVTLAGYGTQTGTSVTFTGIAVPGVTVIEVQ